MKEKNVPENPAHSGRTPSDAKEIDYLELLGRRIDNSPFFKEFKLFFTILPDGKHQEREKCRAECSCSQVHNQKKEVAEK